MSETHTATGHTASNTRYAGKTVLLVDDDPDFLYQQRLLFETTGFEVVTAENESRATELLAEQRVDLAVIDLMMDNPDGGFTLCYRIKKKDASIPVILVTSVNDETGLEFDASTKDERRWIKADAFLAKPVRFEQMRREIDRLLGG